MLIKRKILIKENTKQLKAFGFAPVMDSFNFMDQTRVCPGLGYMSLYHTVFTWYGHKNLVNTVLTVAVSDLHYSTAAMSDLAL